MDSYKIGSEIALPDGIHITLEGAFVVKGGKVFYATENLYDKWGNVLDAEDLLDATHPLRELISTLPEGAKE